MTTSARILEKLAKETTRLIGRRWGESFPFYYVIEHPKSGGTWLARMVADYLELPFPRHTRLPIGFSCVLQSHWRFDPRLRRVSYLYRDGRDVMTSLYFDRVRVSRFSDRPGRDRVRATYERLFGAGYDPEDVVTHLPKFIEHEFVRPGHGTPCNWSDHVAEWVDGGSPDHVVFVSYEELRSDCAAAVARVLRALTREDETDDWKLDRTVDRFSMRRQTGRAPGEADVRQHIRKGIVGDWRNTFSREAAKVFDHWAGDQLVRLGYEADRGWVDRYEYPTP